MNLYWVILSGKILNATKPITFSTAPACTSARASDWHGLELRPIMESLLANTTSMVLDADTTLQRARFPASGNESLMVRFEYRACVWPIKNKRQQLNMSTHHAAAGEVVDLATWANDLSSEKSKAIVKTDGFELARLVIKAGEDMHKNGLCHVNGPTIFHCIEGEIDLQTSDTTIRLCAGQLAYLEPETKHAVTGIQDSVLLLTIVFT